MQRILAFGAAVTVGIVAVACDADDQATTTVSAPVTTAATIDDARAQTPATSAPPTPAPVAAAASDEQVLGGATAGASLGEARPAPELADLVLPDGSPFELAGLQGESTLVFFGYTHCPDVCPATIGELFGVFEARPETQAVFVSVDPERDTPEFLAEWTRYLPENLHAVTGSPGAIRRAADNYGVKYARVETTSTAGYTMSHTADLYLIDAEGRYRLAYPFGTSAAQIVEDLERLDTG